MHILSQPNILLAAEVVASPTVSGALTSLLGPGFCQHPHRTMHNYGKANGHNDEESLGSDQTWHKE